MKDNQTFTFHNGILLTRGIYDTLNLKARNKKDGS